MFSTEGELIFFQCVRLSVKYQRANLQGQREVACSDDQGKEQGGEGTKYRGDIDEGPNASWRAPHKWVPDGLISTQTTSDKQAKSSVL